MDWIHEASPRVVLVVGALAYHIGGSRWAYGRLGASFRSTKRITVQGEVALGPGTEGESSFVYQTYKAGLTAALRPGRLYAEMEDQYLAIQGAAGNIVKVGVVGSPSAGFLASAAFHASTSGNLGSRFASARAEFSRKRLTCLGGVSIGRTKPQVFGVTLPGEPRTSREVFAGVRVAVGAQQLGLVLDTLGLEGVRKNTLTLSWKRPL